MSAPIEWLSCAGTVHSFYQELLSVGSSIMRVEDHLTMQIPGADAELEEAKQKLLALVKGIDDLLTVVS